MFDTQLFILGKVGLAAVLAGLIGLERELDNKPAGLRTHMLTAMSAALLISLVPTVLDVFNTNASMRFDPLRVFEAIVVGISFIGAGTILKGEGKRDVHNLTTAASILITGTIGLVIGLNQIMLAIGVTLLVFIVTFVLGRFEDRFLSG